jgi:hypothetical protein
MAIAGIPAIIIFEGAKCSNHDGVFFLVHQIEDVKTNGAGIHTGKYARFQAGSR